MHFAFTLWAVETVCSVVHLLSEVFGVFVGRFGAVEDVSRALTLRRTVKCALGRERMTSNGCHLVRKNHLAASTGASAAVVANGTVITAMVSPGDLLFSVSCIHLERRSLANQLRPG